MPKNSTPFSSAFSPKRQALRNLYGVALCLLLSLLGACSGGADAPLPTLANIPTPAIPADIPTLNFWESRAGRLSQAQAADFWQFSAQAGDNISLRAVERGTATTLTLYDFLGNVLAQGESVDYTIPTNGLYRVRVQLVGDGATEYELGLGYTDRPNPLAPTPIEIVVGVPTPTPDTSDIGAYQGELAHGTQLTGTLTADTPTHAYTLSARAGEWLTLEMGRVSGTIDPFLRLYDPDGELIAVDDNSGGNRSARIANVRALRDGQYRVQASGGDRYGEYVLSLKMGFQALPADVVILPTPTLEVPFATPTLGALEDGARLQDHAPALGDIGTPSGFARFAFYADAGEQISLGVVPAPNSRLRPMFEVYSPEGILLTSARASTSDAVGAAVVTGVNVPESGAYIVLVMSEDRTSGAFSIAYGRGTTFAQRVRNDATSNARLSGSIGLKGEREAWVIRLQTGDVINVAVSANSGALDPVIELSTLDGQALYRDDNSGGGTAALIRSAEITQGGQYLLRVSDARGQATGDYTLIWRYVNLAPTPTTPPRTQTVLSVEDVVYITQYNFYPFYGDGGQTVEIAVIAKPNSNLDPVLAVLDAEGNVIAEADDSDGTLNPRLLLRLPANGQYTVRVNGYLSGGGYDVTVKTLLP
jgi:hypothetical protein